MTTAVAASYREFSQPDAARQVDGPEPATILKLASMYDRGRQAAA